MKQLMFSTAAIAAFVVVLSNGARAAGPTAPTDIQQVNKILTKEKPTTGSEGGNTYTKRVGECEIALIVAPPVMGEPDVHIYTLYRKDTPLIVVSTQEGVEEGLVTCVREEGKTTIISLGAPTRTGLPHAKALTQFCTDLFLSRDVGKQRREIMGKIERFCKP